MISKSDLHGNRLTELAYDSFLFSFVVIVFEISKHNHQKTTMCFLQSLGDFSKDRHDGFDDINLPGISAFLGNPG